MAPELNFKMPIGGSFEEREGERCINQKRKKKGKRRRRDFSPGVEPANNGRLWRLIDVGFKDD